MLLLTNITGNLLHEDSSWTKKFLVECVKDILDNNSSERYILIADKYHDSIIRSVWLDGNMHPIDYTL